MPNHCSNTFYFTGNEDDIAELKKRVIVYRNPDDEDYTGEPIAFDFNGIVPMPESLNVSTCSTSACYALTLLKLPPDLLLTSSKVFRHLDHILQQLKQQEIDTTNLTVARFIQHLRDNPELQDNCQFDLQLGQQYYDNIQNHGSKDWYDWSVANWGTKWNAYACVIEQDEPTILSGCFETAWSPPEPVFRAIAEQFPNVDITTRYLELGMYFAGSYYSDGGGGLFEEAEETDAIEDFAVEFFGCEFEPDDENGTS